MFALYSLTAGIAPDSTALARHCSTSFSNVDTFGMMLHGRRDRKQMTVAYTAKTVMQRVKISTKPIFLKRPK